MIGERLRQARLGAGLSMDALVDRMGAKVSKQSISKYERGLSVPSSDVLVRIAEALNLRTSFFLQEQSVDLEINAFRRHTNLPKSELNKLKFDICQRVECHQRIQSMFAENTDAQRQAGYGGVPDARKIDSIEDVEELAVRLRKTWQMGLNPIESVVEALEDRNAYVVAIDAHLKFDGLSGWAKITGSRKKHPVLVTSRVVSGDRQRFNLAHELGHLITSTAHLNEEEVANRFAASFLVPKEVVFRELGEKRHRIAFDELSILKQKYGMSMQAWLMRAGDLEIVSKSWLKRAMITFRRRGWHKREPGPAVAPEEPIRLRQLLLRAVAEKLVSAEHAKEIEPSLTEISKLSTQISAAAELLKLPRESRNHILAKAAEAAVDEYRTDEELVAFSELDGVST